MSLAVLQTCLQIVHQFVYLRLYIAHFTILTFDVIVAHFEQFGKYDISDSVQENIHVGQLYWV